jgi:hypothetical protein
MSDGPRIIGTEAAYDVCVRLVASEGGAAFFSRPDAKTRLHSIAADKAGDLTPESEKQHQRAIEEELDRSRSELRARLATDRINHVCLPWGVSGEKTAAALERLGFATAIANRLSGVHAVRRGDSKYWLKRLPNRYIERLPGRGRRWWFLARPSTGLRAGH